MSTPGSTDNPGQMMPVRIMAKCTDGGSLDGQWVDVVTTSSGQIQTANATPDARTVNASVAFPGSSVTLATGKILTVQTIESVFPTDGTPFVTELVNVHDETGAALDLDIYFDVSESYDDWNTTPAENTYAYVTALASGGVVGVCRIRSTDYTTQYSAAATPATSVASKVLVMSGSSGALFQGLNVVVVYAGASTASVASGKLQIEIVVRSKPQVSAPIV